MNLSAKTEEYPLPHIKDLFEHSQLVKKLRNTCNCHWKTSLVTINTHKGVFSDIPENNRESTSRNETHGCLHFYNWRYKGRPHEEPG